jgi:hypothetical protein
VLSELSAGLTNSRSQLNIVMQRKRVLHCPDGFATATGSESDDDLAHAFCQDGESGYCLSVSRFPHEDDLVEVMVYDQIVHKTADVTVELRPDQFLLTLSEQAAAQLDGTTEYIVPLSADADLRRLDAALTVIFDGKHGGTYVRKV